MTTQFRNILVRTHMAKIHVVIQDVDYRLYKEVSLLKSIMYGVVVNWLCLMSVVHFKVRLFVGFVLVYVVYTFVLPQIRNTVF